MLKNIKKRLKDQRGLTLVELLAVIVILGIISAIAVPSIGGIISKSQYDAAKADAIQVLNSAKMYAASHEVDSNTSLTMNAAADTNDLEVYIDEIENLASFTVTFSDGVPTIEATAIDSITEKGEDGAAQFNGTVTVVSEYQYDGGAPE
ncbi:type II secretion system protein [Bacillus sp. V3B]|uniref:type IV pilin protein n=1 Tax=Bacillus sp. V3B TaxID=2804915 RepID=UPI002108606D|nr:type II secretion system protein [Bacillus sp. V3B]MCQ6273517.1 type II secretion system protein [Bacillus sp. V3B]